MLLKIIWDQKGVEVYLLLKCDLIKHCFFKFKKIKVNTIYKKKSYFRNYLFF